MGPKALMQLFLSFLSFFITSIKNIFRCGQIRYLGTVVSTVAVTLIVKQLISSGRLTTDSKNQFLRAGVLNQPMLKMHLYKR